MSDESKADRIKRLKKEADKGRRAPVSIISALEYRREQYDLTQTEFAEVLGLTKSHYSEIVHGKRRLPYDAMRRAYAIGVPAVVLLQ